MYTKPYIWRVPYGPNKRICIYNTKERKTDYLIFAKGLMLPAPDIGQHILSQDPATYDITYDAICTPEELLDYGALPSTGASPLVRTDVLEILREVCPQDFQAFPAVVRGTNPKIAPFELTNYWLINVTNISGAIDEEACEITRNESLHYSSMRYFILKEDHMEGHHLSRLSGRQMRVIVSPHLQKILKKSKIKGLMFEKDDSEKKLKNNAS